MAYSPGNLKKVGGERGSIQYWAYKTTDSVATVNTAGYIADALRRGMQVGDQVDVRITSSNAVTRHTVLAITSGAANLSDGLAVGTDDAD